MEENGCEGRSIVADYVAIDYFMNAKNYKRVSQTFSRRVGRRVQLRQVHYWEATYLEITFRVSEDFSWFNATKVKSSFNQAAGTKTDDSKAWIYRTYRQPKHKHPDWYPDLFDDGDTWIRFDRDRVISFISKLLKNASAIEEFFVGNPLWHQELFEFIYVRFDPKHKLYEFVIKIGRADEMYSRTANYLEHSRGGPDTIFVLFCVWCGSKSEEITKKVFGENFVNVKGKKSKDGDKFGAEYYKVEQAHDWDSFCLAVIDASFQLEEALKEDDQFIDSWYICSESFEEGYDAKPKIMKQYDEFWNNNQTEIEKLLKLKSSMKKKDDFKGAPKNELEFRQKIEELVYSDKRQDNELADALLYRHLAQPELNAFELKHKPWVRVIKT